MLSSADIEELLEKSEGRDLDFKECQYRFQGGDDPQKSELLKDILAFANTTRMHDAYILIGVREVKGGRSEAIGISDHLDDASVQQFINAKTNHAVRFSYARTPFEGVELGVLCIFQKQHRPLWVHQTYGKVRAQSVLVRHGSSTATATPEEIAEIVRADLPTVVQRQAVLSFGFFDPDTAQTSNAHRVAPKALDMPTPEHIPEFGRSQRNSRAGRPWVADPSDINLNFYREGALYLAEQALLVPIRCTVQNHGDAPANDVKVSLVLLCNPAEVRLLTRPALRLPPKFRSRELVAYFLSSPWRIEGTAMGWAAHRDMPKIFAKQGFHFLDELFLRATRTADFTIQATVFADELSAPVVETLSLHVQVDREAVSVEALMATLDNMAAEKEAGGALGPVAPPRTEGS